MPIEGERERERERERARVEQAAAGQGIFPKRTFNLSDILLRYLDYLLMDI